MSALAVAAAPPLQEDDGVDPRQRILIVEDEPRMRSSLVQILAGAGRVILESATGAGAIEALRSQDVQLVLLDIGLPDISGLEVMQWINDRDADVSVIVVSADDRFDSAVRALRHGAAEFVRKPEDLGLLPDRVDAVLQHRRLEREHAATTRQLLRSERLHRFLIEHSPDFVYMLDADGRFVFVNPRVESLLGYGRDEFVGTPYSALVHERDRELARHVLAERRSDSRASSNVELNLLCKRETQPSRPRRTVVAMVSAIGLYDAADGAGAAAGVRRYTGTYGVVRDISERKRAEELISFQALHDQLTQLPNRRLFKEHLELALAQAARSGRMVGVMFIDLDRFKGFNDTYGHLDGDELLKALAQRLRGCVRAGDTVARQGGDEFTILLPDLIHADGAQTIASKIFAELEAPFHINGKEIQATASVGIAIYPRDGDSADLLLKNADIAMYQVKASGRNGSLAYRAEMNTGHGERLARGAELREALQGGQFVLHFQPQVSSSTGSVLGVEVLIRWQHPERGLVYPGEFIDRAEEAGLICAISDWVLDEACGQLAQWHRQGHPGLRMSINLSAMEFGRDDLVERVVSRVSGHGLPRDAIEIEITEGVLLNDVPGVIKKLHQLREQGVRITIDDFGTRYSSLNYLRRFPVNSLKIDQSFVGEIVGGDRASPVLQAIAGIARDFGLHLAAEGVETAHQRQVLGDLGCDEMQGFLFAMPAAGIDIGPLFDRRLPLALAG